MRSHQFPFPFVWVPPISILRMVSRILQWGHAFVYPFDEISAAKLSRSFEVLFSFFLSLFIHCFNFFHFHFQSSCKFHFLGAFWIFLDLAFLFRPLFVFFHFSLWKWHIFSITKFHSYVLTVYSYCLYKSLQFFFIFCKQLDVVHVYKVIIFFLWLVAPSDFF